MIKIYTWVHGNPKSHQINDLMEKIDTECNHTSKFIYFPEISTTVSGWTYATPPAELILRSINILYAYMRCNQACIKRS